MNYQIMYLEKLTKPDSLFFYLKNLTENEITESLLKTIFSRRGYVFTGLSFNETQYENVYEVSLRLNW